MNKEKWRPIARNRKYLISDRGRVKTFHGRWTKTKGKILRDICGTYPETRLYGNDGSCERILTHRLVWETFRGPIPRGFHINHLDGDKHNPRLDNLECVTPGRNLKHAYDTGLRVPPTGSKWHASKLAEPQVVRIKELLAKGRSQTEIAKRYFVHQCTISDIARGITWTGAE